MNDRVPSLAGNFLIAMPNLADPNFWRSVVLLGVHSQEEGAFGLVINRLLDIDLRDILTELDQESTQEDLPGVLAGGPVEPSQGFVLYEGDGASAAPEDIAISDTIVVSGNTETLAHLVQGGSPSARYFLLLGYAGWYPGQMEQEIEENSWLVAPLDTSILFDVPMEDRWAASLASIGIDPGTLVDAGSSEPS